jgi:hypothetical protein
MVTLQTQLSYDANRQTISPAEAGLIELSIFWVGSVEILHQRGARSLVYRYGLLVIRMIDTDRQIGAAL